MRTVGDAVFIEALVEGMGQLLHFVFQALARELVQFVRQGQVCQARQQHHQSGAHQADRQPQAHRQAAGLHGRASST
ncbi:hypothetical protein H096_12018 [Pseudomonas sp. FH1]|nr:hypothetical protein H096_12018 [Pseudomonas sp. FH1]